MRKCRAWYSRIVALSVALALLGTASAHATTEHNPPQARNVYAARPADDVSATYGYGTATASEYFSDRLDLNAYNSGFYTRPTVAYTYASLDDNAIFTFNGHGAPGFIAFYDADGNAQGFINAQNGLGPDCNDYDLTSLPSGALATELLWILYACDTASTSSYYGNLVAYAVNTRGVRYGVGFAGTVYDPQGSYWLRRVAVLLDEASGFGETPYDAVHHARDWVYANPAMQPFGYSGLDTASSRGVGTGWYVTPARYE